jgi:hypothetical protein
MFVIQTPKIYTRPFKSANSAGGQEKQHQELEDYVRNEIPNLDGFVLFDDYRRYEIDFPKSW